MAFRFTKAYKAAANVAELSRTPRRAVRQPPAASPHLVVLKAVRPVILTDPKEKELLNRDLTCTNGSQPADVLALELPE